jgi:hypothetical protein
MAQRRKQPETVGVRLLCTLSGDGRSWAPGSIVRVDAAEAGRLIGLGAAEAVAEK